MQANEVSGREGTGPCQCPGEVPGLRLWTADKGGRAGVLCGQAGQWEGTGPHWWPGTGLPLSCPDQVGGPSPGCHTQLGGPVQILPLPRSLRRSFTRRHLPSVCCPLCARTRPASSAMARALTCHCLHRPPTDRHRWRISMSLALHQVPDMESLYPHEKRMRSVVFSALCQE